RLVHYFFFFSMRLPPLIPTLFPYTTLFRSCVSSYTKFPQFCSHFIYLWQETVFGGYNLFNVQRDCLWYMSNLIGKDSVFFLTDIDKHVVIAVCYNLFGI